jgi:hypothetical protein
MERCDRHCNLPPCVPHGSEDLAATECKAYKDTAKCFKGSGEYNATAGMSWEDFANDMKDLACKHVVSGGAAP